MRFLERELSKVYGQSVIYGKTAAVNNLADHYYYCY